MAQYGFYFNAKRCTGCKACALACKDYRNLPEEYALRNVYEYGGGAWAQDETGTWVTDAFAYYVSSACNHCARPACMQVCPVDAYDRDEETGIVKQSDPSKCIACGSCVAACPYGEPVIDQARQVSIKCDGCLSRVQEGNHPICVEACPMRALEFGDIEELRAAHGESVRAVAPLPDPALTEPNYLVDAPAGAQPVGSELGEVRNLREIA